MSTELSTQANDAASIIGDDPAPMVSNPGSVSVTLLRGVKSNLTLEWQKDAIVRELTGTDEEALASYDIKTNVTYSEYMSYLLKLAVVSIGSISVKDSQDTIDDLIIGDRDLLFLGVIKATYGRYREFDVTCRACEKQNSIQVDLDKDFPIEDNPSDITKPLTVTLKNKSVITMNYPTGGDSQWVAKKANNTAEQNTMMLSRCAILGLPYSNNPEAWARGLSLADRSKMVKALFSAQPGPRMEEVKTQCAHCNAIINLALDWVSLLFG